MTPEQLREIEQAATPAERENYRLAMHDLLIDLWEADVGFETAIGGLDFGATYIIDDAWERQQAALKAIKEFKL